MHVLSFAALSGMTLISLASAAPQSLARRELQVSNTLPQAWSYSGCFTDQVSSRTLPLASFADDAMTEGKCIGFCDQKGYSFAGVEYGRECWCGYQIGSGSSLVADSDCSFPCAGASGEPCGAGDRLNIFTNGVAPAVENPGVNGYTSLGCYTDNVQARTLSTFEPTSDGLVFVRGCTEICASNGFKYAGVEYGQECFCGNDILNGAQSAPASECNMPCNANKTETCGGSNRINLYSSA